MTVIVIVMIMSAIVVLAAGPALARQKTTPTCASNLHQLAAAYNMYMTDNDQELPQSSGIVYHYMSEGTPSQRGIVRCPLTGIAYDDAVNWQIIYNPSHAEAIHQPPPMVYQSLLPDGRPIPAFDPESDVLVRCMSHGYDGFDPNDYGAYYGKVLGVRLNGAVAKVPPLSCWQLAFLMPEILEQYPPTWQTCDLPHQP
jgi:hypothetical protein